MQAIAGRTEWNIYVTWHSEFVFNIFKSSEIRIASTFARLWLRSERYFGSTLMGGDKSLTRLFSFSDVAYHMWSYVDIQSLHKLMTASTQYVSDKHFEILSALVRERYYFSLVDIPREVVDYVQLHTIKAAVKRVLWYTLLNICSLLCLRQSTAYTQAKVFRACSSLIFLTGLVAIHFCMWLWIWTCNRCFFDPIICWVDSIWDVYVMESVPLFLVSGWKAVRWENLMVFMFCCGTTMIFLAQCEVEFDQSMLLSRMISIYALFCHCCHAIL